MHRPSRRQRFVENRTHGIDLGPIVRSLTTRFLGSLVVDQPAVVAVLVEPALGRKLVRGNFGAPFGADDNRVWAQTAVTVAVRMCVRDGISDLYGDLDRATHVHRSPCRLCAQRLPLLKL